MRRRKFGHNPAGPRGGRKMSPRPGLEMLEARQLLTTILVTNTADSGEGSLRSAILVSNATMGTNQIQFNIADATGVQTISPLSPLPTITNAVAIDGTTEPGTGSTPLIDLDGTSAGVGTNGLTVNLTAGSGTTAPATIRGLAIGNFSGAGVAITGVGGNAVEQSLIGVNAAGTAAAPNGVGVSIVSSANNTIGGLSGAFRNVISGNKGDGVLISGSTASQNLLQGNTIGLDVSGSKALGNGTGVEIAGAGSNTVGGVVTAARNVISGNANAANLVDTTFAGINIHDLGASGDVVEGNYIGTNSSGTAAIGNGIGVLVALNASSNTVGGTATADRNVISGNQAANIDISEASNDVVLNNYVGTTADGSAAIGGSQAILAGIEINAGSIGNTIGGASAGVGNLIAGNAGPGIEARGTTTAPNTANNLIAGNLVGTNSAGTTAIPNVVGILIRDGATGNILGGTNSGARNVISGNTGAGVSLSGSATTGNVVKANLIGLGIDGASALANSGDGVNVDGASKTTVGGTAVGAGNTIADNGRAGVFVNAGTGVDISRNVIFSNVGLGIDLAPVGVNPNIATSPGTGPNNLLNYPVITAVTTNSGATTVAGQLNAVPSTSYSIELYASTTADPSGNGQGKTFVGTATVTTDATGAGAFSAVTTAAVPVGSFVTATAIDGAGNTSEFSADVANTAPIADLGLVLYGTPNPVPSGGFLTYTIGVANGGPSPATNVVVTDTLPTGVTYQSSTTSAGSVSISGSTVTVSLGSLAAGSTATITFTTTTSTVGTVANTATVAATQTDPLASNNSATVSTSVVAGVTLGVTSAVNPTTATVGTPETFTFVVNNSSTTTTATNVILTAPLPAGATYVSSTGSQGSTAINPTATGFGATIGSLAPGASATVQLVLLPTTAGTLSLQATTQADQPNIIPSGAITSPSVTVNAAAVTPPVGSSGPTVTNFTRTGLHNQKTNLVLTFDGPLSPVTAQNIANYTLVSAGRDGKFNTKDDVKVALNAAVYSSLNDTVIVRPKKPLSFRRTFELTVNGSSPGGVSNANGVLLDGARNGASGTDYIQVFSGVGPGNLVSTTAVDSVLASGMVSVAKVQAHRARKA